MSQLWLHALIAAGLLINLGSLLLALDRLRRLQLPRSERQAVASVILPLTGRVESLEQVVRLLEAQTLRPRRLIVAVESEGDPAFARAQSVARQASLPIEIVVGGLASDQAQKCRNQQAALDRIDAADDIIVLMDGDILPERWWLSALVSPIVDGHCDIVTGCRWQRPVAPRLGAHLITQIDRAVMLTPRINADFAHVVWGGSVAISRAAAARLDLRHSLDRTLSDDLSIARYAGEAGVQILTRGALLVPSPADHTLSEAWRFARRQYQMGRIYRPWLWWLAALIIGVRLAAWIAILAHFFATGQFAVAAAAMASLAVAKQIVVSKIGARVGLPDSPAVCAAQLMLGVLQPVVDGFHLSVIIAAWWTRRVAWGHVIYDVRGPYRITLTHRRAP